MKANEAPQQYILKSALVAEIEKWISGWTERLNTNPSNLSFFEGGIELGKSILSFIDTLEVKKMQEELVSNNYSALLPCIYNRTLEERVKYCKYCSAACEGRVKEPVSEDLEKASYRFACKCHPLKTKYSTSSPNREVIEAFKTGAKWQKEKDQKK